MALWQCDFHLVPRACVQDSAGVLVPRVTQAAADEGGWWCERQPPLDYSARLTALLPPLQSWSPKLLLWGASDGDRVDVYLEEGCVSDISVRIDLSEPSPSFFVGVLAFARACEAVFLGESLDLTEASPECLAAALQQSRAARFLRDPHLYFRRVAVSGYEDA